MRNQRALSSRKCIFQASSLLSILCAYKFSLKHAYCLASDISQHTTEAVGTMLLANTVALLSQLDSSQHPAVIQSLNMLKMDVFKFAWATAGALVKDCVQNVPLSTLNSQSAVSRSQPRPSFNDPPQLHGSHRSQSRPIIEDETTTQDPNFLAFLSQVGHCSSKVCQFG
jgi:hypothetical protein